MVCFEVSEHAKVQNKFRKTLPEIKATGMCEQLLLFAVFFLFFVVHILYVFLMFPR